MAENERNLTPQGKPRGADIMEGANKARNNRDFDTAKRNLKNTFNPNAVREVDNAAYEFLDHNVYKAVRVKDDKGKETDEKTGEIIIVYFGGEHVSNVDLALIRKLEEDVETQEKGNAAIETAGYLTQFEEPEADAVVLS